MIEIIEKMRKDQNIVRILGTIAMVRLAWFPL